MRRHSAVAAVLAVAFLALGLASCAREAGRGGEPGGGADSLPAAALTGRAARDSARVGRLVLAYFEFLADRKPGKALELFFPESLRVAAPDGGIEVEGRSAGAARQIAADESAAVRIRRIVLLRRTEIELLEQTYRETWWLRYIPDRSDSAALERRIHVIQQLGSDTRWLGRMSTGR